MSFSRYPKYKDSGIEWLGGVPAHWEVKPLKRNLNLLTARTERRDHPVALENIESWTGRFVPTDTEFEGEGVAFIAGDILFGKLRPYLAKVYRAEESGEAVGDFHVMRPGEGIDSRFAQYEILNREFIAVVDGSTFGSKMPRASWEFVGGMPMTTPPLNEQIEIAAFLDCETAKIDELVLEQQRLVELLKEKRQAVISHVVTKGLNPDAPVKPSGVDWLGEVPSHWMITPLKRCAQILDCKHHTVEFLEEGFPIVSIRELTEDRIDLSGAKLTSKDEWDNLRDGRIPRRGDMIFCRNASVGAVGFVDFDAPFSMGQDVCLIRVHGDGRYMHFQLASVIVKSQIEALLVGATIRRLNVEEIRGLFVAFPPIEEQRAIAEFLLKEASGLGDLIQEAQGAISLLLERRAAIVSAAVTGQIDVRRAAEREAA